MTMTILIDGVDLTGKSTLAKKLASSTRPPAFQQHNSGPPTTGGPISEYLDPLLSTWRYPVVVDRSYVSELVWPQVFGRETTLDLETFDYITDRVGSIGGVHVHAFRDVEKLRRELIEAQEPVYHIDQAVRLYEEAYRRIAERGGLVLPWDYETMEDGADFDWLVDAAQDYWREKNS